MTREYRARHAFPVNAVRRPYVIVRKSARHDAKASAFVTYLPESLIPVGHAVSTVRDGA